MRGDLLDDNGDGEDNEGNGGGGGGGVGDGSNRRIVNDGQDNE